MTDLAQQYSYDVTWSEEDGEYVATVAELPSVSFLDPDRETALRDLRKLVSVLLEDMVAAGEVPPRPHREIDAAVGEVKDRFGDALRRLGE